MVNVQKSEEIYRCQICGNIVEVLYSGGGELICCGEPMELMKKNTVDANREKHVPVINKKGDIILVKIGIKAHPSEENHYIQWIEIIADDKVYRRKLKPKQKPEAQFYVKAKTIVARAYCNIHGLWAKRQ